MSEPLSMERVFSWLAAAAAAVFTFVFREQWSRTKRLDERVAALERSVATKQDVTGVYERINDIGDQMNAQHATILKTLLEQQTGGR